MTYQTWCDPFFRKDSNAWLIAADVPRALEHFRKSGTVKTLFLNPIFLRETLNGKPNKDFLNLSLPDGIEVMEHAGVGGWEIMAEIQGKAFTDTITTHQDAKMANPIVSRGIKTPDRQDRPVDLHPSASSSYENTKTTKKQAIQEKML